MELEFDEPTVQLELDEDGYHEELFNQSSLVMMHNFRIQHPWMHDEASEEGGNTTTREVPLLQLSRIMKKFLFFCIKREQLKWRSGHYRSFHRHHHRNNATSDNEEEERKSSQQILSLKNMLLHSSEMIDFDHSVVLTFFHKAMVYNDMEWVRVFVEYGVDITILEKFALIEWSSIMQSSNNADDVTSAERQVDEQSQESYTAMAMPHYLVDTLGVDIYDFQSSASPLVQISDVIVQLPFYRYLLQCHGQIPDYHSQSYRMNISLTPDMVNFLTVLIDNDLIAKNNEVTLNQLVKRYGNVIDQSSRIALTLSKIAKLIHFRRQHIYHCKESFCDRLKELLWSASCGEDLLLHLLERRQIDVSNYQTWRTTLSEGNSESTTVYSVFEDEGSLTEDYPIQEYVVSPPQNRYPCKMSFSHSPRAKLIEQAASVGFERVLKTILVNAKQDDMREYQRLVNHALFHAGSISLLKFLIEEERADVNYIDPKTGDTVLFAICRNMSDDNMVVEAIRYIYEEAYFILTEEVKRDKDDENQDVIHEEEGEDGSEITDQNKDDHSQQKDGSTALHDLCSSGRISCLDALLKYGYGYQMEIEASIPVDSSSSSIDVQRGKRNRRVGRRGRVGSSSSHQTKHNDTLSMTYQSTRCMNIDDYLLQNMTMNPLIFVVANQLADPLGILIKHFTEHHSANINATEVTTGDTPLIYAVKNNDWDTAKVLVEQYADVHMQNYRGESALSLAGMHKDLLLQWHEEVNGNGKKNSNGQKHANKRKRKPTVAAEYD